MILLVVEAPEITLADALIEAGLLDRDSSGDHEAIQRAAQRLIEIIATEKII